MSNGDAADLVRQALIECTQLLDRLVAADKAQNAAERSLAMAGTAVRGGRLAEAMFAAEESAAAAANNCHG